MALPAGPTHYLLSAHGTLLTWDAARHSLAAIRIDGRGGHGKALTLAGGATPPSLWGTDAIGKLTVGARANWQGDGLDNVLAGVTLEPGQGGARLALKAKNGFLTVRINGTTAFEAPEPLEWETFLPVTEDDIGALSFMMSRAWLVTSPAAVVQPRHIGFSTNFLFHFRQHNIDLRKAFPGLRRDDGNAVIVQKPSGEKITARPTRRALAGAPRIWLSPRGNAGNRALQFLTAEAIRALVPGATVENIHLKEWGLFAPSAAPDIDCCARTGEEFCRIDLEGMADCLQRQVVEAIVIDGYPFHMANYPQRHAARTLLRPPPDAQTAIGFGDRELVCSIRAAEILNAAHEDYLVLPPAYYKLLERLSGLDLVFFGQISDNPYCDALRTNFPSAKFIAGRNAAYDFEVLRRSRNIAASISTFAWLAAWLSEASRVYLPVGGLFNPTQNPRQMHLPLHDPSYRFILLPFSKSVDARSDPKGFQVQQDLLGSCARQISHEEALQIADRAALTAPRAPGVGGFDPGYYISRYPDAALEAYAGRRSALEHYLHVGFREGRRPVDFDRNAYCAAYPDAAMAVAEGKFSDPLHHYTADGWRRGYAPRPVR
jgi:hypothetical protein